MLLSTESNLPLCAGDQETKNANEDKNLKRQETETLTVR